MIPNASDNGTIMKINYIKRAKIIPPQGYTSSPVSTNTIDMIFTPNINPADFFAHYKALREDNMEAVNPPTLKP